MKNFRKYDIQGAILKTVAVAGTLSVALLAPNALQVLAQLGIIQTHKRKKEIINRSRDRLIKAGLLERNNGSFISLTSAGESKLRELELMDYKIPTPRHWDKRWRVLIFDIPEKKKQTREKVRNTLVSIGFKWLQDSVWVYPYSCEDLITLLKTDFRIGKDILYIVADSIENDYRLKKHFGLV